MGRSRDRGDSEGPGGGRRERSEGGAQDSRNEIRERLDQIGERLGRVEERVKKLLEARGRSERGESSGES
jgi:hypothetical protein